MTTYRRTRAVVPILILGTTLPAQRPTPARSTSAIEGVAQARAERKLTERYDPFFRKYTKRFFGPAFDWHYFKAQGVAESGLKSTAVSWVGARGVMQLMPSTYHEISSRRPEFQSIDDPEWNIAAGIMHDRYLWQFWSNQIPEDQRHRFMFASYNAGEGTIHRALSAAQTQLGTPVWEDVERIAPSITRWRYLETLGYVRRIDSVYARWSTPP